MKLIVINGSAESGKDKFIQFVSECCDKDMIVFNESTIDPVKRAMESLGMDPNNKTPENRQMMVDMKQLWIKSTNGQGPLEYVQKKFDFYKGQYQIFDGPLVLFMHCREPEEIQKIVERFGEDCETLLIKSHLGKALKNGADDVVENYDYTHNFTNDKDLNYLKSLAEEFAAYIKGK